MKNDHGTNALHAYPALYGAGHADIKFPITKAELLEKVGDKMIRTGPEAYTPFRVIINKMPMDEFSCAAEFYCNHSAS